jgi:hypothetical protein
MPRTHSTDHLLAVVPTYAGLLAVQAGSGFFRSLVFTPGLMLIRAQFSSDRRATAMALALGRLRVVSDDPALPR